MELQLKRAEEYKAARAAFTSVQQTSLTDAATVFINRAVKPEIERAVKSPGYGHVSVRAPFEQAAVDEVCRLLTGLGFTVRKSHDGGGMYETIIIGF